MQNQTALEKIQTVSFWPVLIAIAIGNFSAVLCSTTVTIALPVFMEVFDSSIITVQWTMTGYLLAEGIVAPLIGFLADRLSLKRTYLMAMWGFLLTVSLCGFAWNVESLIVFRILQGCFGGMIMPLTMSMIYQVIPSERQAFALSIWSVSGGLAPALGPTVAGIVTDALGWQWVFFMNVPFVLIAILVANHYIPYYKLSANDQSGQKFDYVGLASGMIGTYCLLFIFSKFSEWGLSGKSLAMLAVGLISIGIFIYNEFKLESPLLYLKVLQYPTFAWSMVIIVATSACMNMSIVVLPIYLQDIMNYSTTMSALLMLPGPLLVFFVVPLLGKFYDRIGPKVMLTALISIGFIAMFMLRQLTLTTTALFIIIAVIARDMGFASITMPATNVGMTVIPTEYTNHAAAVSSWIRQCVISLWIGVINTFLALRTQHYLAMADGDGMLYNESYVHAIKDMSGIGFVLVALALFAVSRLKTNKTC